MVRTVTAWENAWNQVDANDQSVLSELVHEVLSKKSGATRRPSHRAVKHVFTKFFADGSYRTQRYVVAGAALPVELRHINLIYSDKQISEEAGVQIARAMRIQAQRLHLTCEFYQQLDRAATKFIGTDKKGPLLARAAELTYQHDTLTTEMINQVLDEIYDVPSAAKVRRLLEDPKVVVELETLLSAAFAGIPGDSSHATGSDLPDDVDLRWFLGPVDASEDAPSAGTEAAWFLAKAAGVGAWSGWVRTVDLSSQSPPPIPPLCEPPRDRPRTGDLPSDTRFVRRLDSSIEGRVAASLRADLAERRSLPKEPELIRAEIQRATQPLGLDHEDSRTLVLLGALTIAPVSVDVQETESEEARRRAGVLGSGLRDTAASAHVRKHFRRWANEVIQARGKAGFPSVWASVLEEPTAYYLSYLWMRVHNDEVYGRADRNARAAFDVLTGLALTLTDRLRTLPSSAARLFLVDDDSHLDSEADTSLSPLRMQAEVLVDEVIRIRERVGAPAFAQFFTEATVSSKIHAEQWSEWAADAGSNLAYSAVVEWVALHWVPAESRIEQDRDPGSVGSS